MIYQQEVREVNDFYDRYKDRRIVYSKEVSQKIGIVQKDTSIKLGTRVLHGVLISSTMESFVIMAKVDDSTEQALHDESNSMIVQLKFVRRETGKTELFTLHTKFLNTNTQGLEGKDLKFIAMQIKRKIPNDLIRIYGLYHKDLETKLQNKKKQVECLLLANDNKTDCLTQRISKNELVLNIDDASVVQMNQKALAILKIVKTGEVIEIIGTVSKMDLENDGDVHLTLNYNIEDQSPRFGYSIHVLSNLINS